MTESQFSNLVSTHDFVKLETTKRIYNSLIVSLFILSLSGPIFEIGKELFIA